MRVQLNGSWSAPRSTNGQGIQKLAHDQLASTRDVLLDNVVEEDWFILEMVQAFTEVLHVVTVVNISDGTLV